MKQLLKYIITNKSNPGDPTHILSLNHQDMNKTNLNDFLTDMIIRSYLNGLEQ